MHIFGIKIVEEHSNNTLIINNFDIISQCFFEEIMKIKNGGTYKVKLCFEPNEINKHKIEKGNEETFEFSGKDLIYAILSAGMPDVFLSKQEKEKKRLKEIIFKTNLFETFITSNGEGILTFDNTRKNIWIVQRLEQLIIGLECFLLL